MPLYRVVPTMNTLVKSTLLILICLSVTLFGQTFDEDSNWFKEIGRYDDYFSRFDFRRYTKEDVAIAKLKFLEIEGDKTLNEWEGLYYRESMVGHEELMWSRKSGFVQTYTYHTLAFLRYGTVDSTGDFLSLRSTKSQATKRDGSARLTKVKFGNTHFLVPVNSLAFFAEEAAGLSVDRDYDENKYYWVEFARRYDKVFGQPIFPKEFTHVRRTPIVVKLAYVSRPRLVTNHLDDGSINYQEHHYLITLDGGRNKGVRRGMSFYIADLDERIDVTHVDQTKSIALLNRSVESGKEICFKTELTNPPDHDQVQFPCKPTKIRLTARTLSRALSF